MKNVMKYHLLFALVLMSTATASAMDDAAKEAATLSVQQGISGAVEDECPICMSANMNPWKCTRCQKESCAECINRACAHTENSEIWGRPSAGCPFCRQPIPENELYARVEIVHLHQNAQAGKFDALSALGNMYLISSHKEAGIKAREYLQLAADNREPLQARDYWLLADAQYMLSDMCEKGIGGDQDFNKAAQYKALAAQNGHLEAHKYLKLMHLSTLSDTQALFDLGLHYYTPLDRYGLNYERLISPQGKEYCLNKVRAYFGRAAALGHQQARAKLDEMNKSG